MSPDHKQAKIDNNILTSDNGWGCMIRVAQMIMANVLARHRLEKSMAAIDDDTYGSRKIESSVCDIQKELEDEEEKKRSIIKLFLDNLMGDEAPFSIQNFVESGYTRYKRMPGEWYGSNSAAVILRDLNSNYKPENDLEVVIFNENGIFEKK